MVKEEEYREYSSRWVMLTLFSLSTVCSFMMLVTCSPITRQLTNVVLIQIYDVPPLAVNACVMVFFAAFIPVVFPSNYVLGKYGLRTGILIGMSLTFAGSVARIGGFQEFYWILIGQSIAALGQPFLLNGTVQLAILWFRPESVRAIQRTKATAIATTAIPVGSALGLGVTVVFVGSGSGKDAVGMLMVIEAIFIGVVLIANLFLFASKPPSSPSIIGSQERQNFSDSLRSLTKNKNFIYLFISFSAACGTFNTFTALVAQLIGPYGFNSVIPT
jgi:fucose permease